MVSLAASYAPVVGWRLKDMRVAHGVWLGLLVCGVLVDAAVFGARVEAIAVITLASIPVIAAWFAARTPNNAGARAGVFVAWTFAASAACLLGGAGAGLGFATWFAAPVAASALLGRREGVWEAGLFSTFAFVVVGLLYLTGAAHPAGAGWALGGLAWAGAFAAIAFVSLAVVSIVDTRARAIGSWARQARKAQNLMAAAPLSVLRVRLDGLILEAHGAGDALELGAVAGGDMWSILDASERARLAQAVRRAVREGDEEALFARVQGRRAAVSVRPFAPGEALVIVRDAEGEAQSIDAIRTQRDEALARLAKQGSFFASMSHELRTPLNAILGFSEAMQARLFGPMAPKYAEYADDIHDSAAHLLALVDDVLDFSKLEAGRYDLDRSVFDIREVVEESARLVRQRAEASGIRFRVEVEDTALMVNADRRAMKQILLNLLANAVKFTGSGGRVEVSARIEGDMLALEVRDTGPGISAEDVARLGRPYVQAAAGKASVEGGTGLGLAIVRALLAVHGGRLEIDSVLGEGTTMRALAAVVAVSDHDGPGQEPSRAERLDPRAQLDRLRDAGWGKPSGAGGA